MKKPYCTAIILAAGTGSRMGTQVKKQFLLLKGKEILAHTIAHFEQADGISEIILVGGADGIQTLEELKVRYGWRKISHIVTGGALRQNSVENGLKAVSKDAEIVLVHDGVRPFVTTDMIEGAINGAEAFGACVVGVPAKDTIKVCDEDEMVLKTPERKALWQIQTPQTFQKALFEKAYKQASVDGFVGTDDASLVEHLGEPVKVIMGSYRNIKITTKEDLLLATCFLEVEEA